VPPRPTRPIIHKSESSPSLAAQPFQQSLDQDRSRSPDHSPQYGNPGIPGRFVRQEYIRSNPIRNDPILRNAIRNDSALRDAIRGDLVRNGNNDLDMDMDFSFPPSPRQHKYTQSMHSRSPRTPSGRPTTLEYTQNMYSSSSKSPPRTLRQDPMAPYVPHRDMTGSPPKILDNVIEKDEVDSIVFKEYMPPSPKKRSRSPMKKMFGERGWLGVSPDEKPGQNLGSNGETKKTTMMEKLKNKLEEFVSPMNSEFAINLTNHKKAEKADLTPNKPTRTSREKPAKLSVLAVSLRPPQQARIFMEVELMLVHTANTFLMNQFSQGRLSVDTIKKTVDAWKNKGRAMVIEFMYDQATQRELIAANQQNLRFYGGSYGNDVRINSMLYNWKQVASIMSIRTFCYADTIIMKLLFDVEQMLELLGAGENLMLRLQQIRTTCNELIRAARHKKDLEDLEGSLPRGREMAWDPHTSTGSSTHTGSFDDPYGGLKLVPDSYVE
jgi:hypothetical protein